MPAPSGWLGQPPSPTDQEAHMAKQFIQSLVTFMVASKKKQIVVLSIVGVLGGLCSVVATSAQAQQVIMNTIANNPTPVPTCLIDGKVAPDWHWDPVQNKCVQNAPVAGQTCTTTKDNVVVCVSNPVATIGNKTVSSSDVASGHVIIGL